MQCTHARLHLARTGHAAPAPPPLPQARPIPQGTRLRAAVQVAQAEAPRALRLRPRRAAPHEHAQAAAHDEAPDPRAVHAPRVAPAAHLHDARASGEGALPHRPPRSKNTGSFLLARGRVGGMGRVCRRKHPRPLLFKARTRSLMHKCRVVRRVCTAAAFWISSAAPCTSPPSPPPAFPPLCACVSGGPGRRRDAAERAQPDLRHLGVQGGRAGADARVSASTLAAVLVLGRRKGGREPNLHSLCLSLECREYPPDKHLRTILSPSSVAAASYIPTLCGMYTCADGWIERIPGGTQQR